MSLTAWEQVDRAAKGYGIPVNVWRPTFDGVVLSTGAGLGMATMDVLDDFRWLADIGGGREYPKLGDWLTWYTHLLPEGLVVAHCWFSISDPEWLVAALDRVPPDRLIVRSNLPLGVGVEVDTIDDLVDETRTRHAYAL